MYLERGWGIQRSSLGGTRGSDSSFAGNGLVCLDPTPTLPPRAHFLNPKPPRKLATEAELLVIRPELKRTELLLVQPNGNFDTKRTAVEVHNSLLPNSIYHRLTASKKVVHRSIETKVLIAGVGC